MLMIKYYNKSRLDQYKETIIKMYKENKSCPEIANILELNISPRQIQRLIKKEGISRTVKQALKVAEPKRVQKIKDKWKDYKINKSKIIRQGLYPSIRYKVFKKDNFKCVLCGWGQEQGIRLEVDHIKPVCEGGKNNIDNLRTLCHLCNVGRNNTDYKATFVLNRKDFEILKIS